MIGHNSRFKDEACEVPFRMASCFKCFRLYYSAAYPIIKIFYFKYIHIPLFLENLYIFISEKNKE